MLIKFWFLIRNWYNGNIKIERRCFYDEIFEIRWHMGLSEDKSQYKEFGEAMEKYPIVLVLHEADLETSILWENVSKNKE